jgi:hypothetical protein
MNDTQKMAACVAAALGAVCVVGGIARADCWFTAMAGGGAIAAFVIAFPVRFCNG